MKKLIPLLLLSFFLTACSSLPQKAQTWQTANQAIVDEHIVPRHQQLADASYALQQQAKSLCTEPSEAKLENVRRGFHQTMDGWMSIQHIRNGPVELLTRYHRYQLWPDKHNTGSKQLGKMLGEQDIDVLQTDHFARTSVAVQGLSALERLLFNSMKGPETFLATFSDNGQSSYRCQLVMAITNNLATMSSELVDEWAAKPTPFHTLFLSSGQLLGERMTDKSLAEKPEVSSTFLNHMTTQVQSVIDQKLKRPMADNTAKAKPRYAESWRSERSMRNIRLNLQAVESLYDTGFASMLKSKSNGLELDKQIKLAFKASHAAAKAIDQPLSDTLKDESQRPALEKLVATSRKLQSLLSTALPQAVEIPLGFNALDGD